MWFSECCQSTATVLPNITADKALIPKTAHACKTTCSEPSSAKSGIAENNMAMAPNLKACLVEKYLSTINENVNINKTKIEEFINARFSIFIALPKMPLAKFCT